MLSFFCTPTGCLHRLYMCTSRLLEHLQVWKYSPLQSLSGYVVLACAAWIADLLLSNGSGLLPWTHLHYELLKSKFKPPDLSVICAPLKPCLTGIDPVMFQQIPSVPINRRMFILMVNSKYQFNIMEKYFNYPPSSGGAAVSPNSHEANIHPGQSPVHTQFRSCTHS